MLRDTRSIAAACSPLAPHRSRMVTAARRPAADFALSCVDASSGAMVTSRSFVSTGTNIAHANLQTHQQPRRLRHRRPDAGLFDDLARVARIEALRLALHVGKEAGVLVGHLHEAGDAEPLDEPHGVEDLLQPQAKLRLPGGVQQSVVAVDLEE